MFLSPERKWDEEIRWNFQFACFPFLFHVSLNSNLQVVSLEIRLDLNFQGDRKRNGNWGLPDELRRFLEKFRGELRAYFSGVKPYLDLPYALNCSHLTTRVFSELRTIPLGEVITYGDLACRVGLERGARAVGQILARNPLPLIFPCHRVISKAGLGGYSQGRLLKYLLLLLERYTKL